MKRVSTSIGFNMYGGGWRGRTLHAVAGVGGREVDGQSCGGTSGMERRGERRDVAWSEPSPSAATNAIKSQQVMH